MNDKLIRGVIVVSIVLASGSPVCGVAQLRGNGKSGRESDPSRGFVEPARYQLELVLPRAAETSASVEDESPAIPSGHRIYRAYPGLEYNIRAVVLGGAFPFRFALKDAPPE